MRESVKGERASPPSELDLERIPTKKTIKVGLEGGLLGDANRSSGGKIFRN